MISLNTGYDVGAELSAARAIHLGNHQQLAALVEEVGELAQALIDHDRDKQTASQVYAEAIQVAAMAIRIAEEGSGEFTYKYTHKCTEDFQAKVR